MFRTFVLMLLALVGATPATPPRPRRATAAKAVQRHCTKPPPEPSHPVTRRTWLSGFLITEYYSAPERWANGALVRTPGLASRHRVDWLYSARGVSMEGDGIDSAGRHVHIDNLGTSGWVDAAGRPTYPVCLGEWSNGSPVWRGGGWRNRAGAVTYPLASGGWSNGSAARFVPYGGVTFAPGSSLPLHPYRTAAVDPHLIPMGSRIYIPAYRHISGGWFVAQDTGGAIKSHHIDVYRPPPASPSDLGRVMRGVRVLVIPPGSH